MKKGRVFRAILPTSAKWSVKKKMKEKVMNGMGGFFEYNVLNCNVGTILPTSAKWSVDMKISENIIFADKGG